MTPTRTGKKQQVLWAKRQLKTRAYALFVHFFTVTSRLRGGIPSSDVLLRTLTQDYKFLFLPLNFVAVSKNSILGEFTYFWDFAPVGKIATKFEKKRSLLNSDVCAPVAVAKVPQDLSKSKLRCNGGIFYKQGGFTLQGLQNNIVVGILFIDAWFRGKEVYSSTSVKWLNFGQFPALFGRRRAKLCYLQYYKVWTL